PVLVRPDLRAAGPDDDGRLRAPHDRFAHRCARPELTRRLDGRDPALEDLALAAGGPALEIVAAQPARHRGDEVVSILVVARMIDQAEQTSDGELAMVGPRSRLLKRQLVLLQTNLGDVSADVVVVEAARLVVELEGVVRVSERVL